MKKNISLTKEFLVLDNHSAKSMGSGDLNVLSTPMLVAFMEESSKELLNNYLSKEQGSVGSNININHIAPTKIGEKITVHTKIKENKNYKIIKFNIIAYNEEQQEIANAEHTRVIINNEKFMQKLNSK